MHLFGTDFTGLDLFSRSIHAARASLGVAFVGVMISFILGAAIERCRLFWRDVR